MKVLIVGAGGQGGPCASILSRDSDCSKVILGDIDASLLAEVSKKICSDKLETTVVDASSAADVAEKAMNVDVIIDLAPPWLSPNIIQGAINSNSHYVSTAFDEPFWTETIEGRPLSYDEKLKEKGLSALLGCGMAPGIINVLTRYYADKFDTLDSIKLRVAKKNLDSPPYSDVVGVWNPGWSPKQALMDCANPAVCFRDGKFEMVPDYGEIEDWSFPEPVGNMLVSHHSHEEPYSMPGVFKEKGLKYCDFKYYVTAQAATLVKMGLASTEEIDVKGVRVKPIDVVMELIPKPGNAFLNENPDTIKNKDENSYVAMMIEIKGKMNGKDEVKRVHLPNLQKPALKLYDIFGTSIVNVALPAVVGAKMLMEGEKKGIVYAEELDAEKFLSLFEQSGHPWKWEEV